MMSGTASYQLDVEGCAIGVALDGAPDSARLVILGHGAGGSADHATTRRLAGVLVGRGCAVLRFDFPYRAAGRGAPDRLPVLQRCFAHVVASAHERFPTPAVWLGGHSMGGRVASHLVADGLPVAGLVLFAYPWHPPGRPDKPRVAHLQAITAPTLCVNGTRDTFCTRAMVDERVADWPHWTQHWLEGADHGYAVLKRSGRTAAEVDEEMATACQRRFDNPEPLHSA